MDATSKKTIKVYCNIFKKMLIIFLQAVYLLKLEQVVSHFVITQYIKLKCYKKKLNNPVRLEGFLKYSYLSTLLQNLSRLILILSKCWFFASFFVSAHISLKSFRVVHECTPPFDALRNTVRSNIISLLKSRVYVTGINVLVPLVGYKLFVHMFPFQLKYLELNKHLNVGFLLTVLWNIVLWYIVCYYLLKMRVVFPV